MPLYRGSRRLILRGGSNPIPGVAAAAFLARTSGLTTRETNAYINLINGLVADSVWSLIDVLYIFATNNTTTAGLNLKGSTWSPLTSHGGMTFNADIGYTGNGSTGYLEPGAGTSLTTVGGYAQDSASLGVYIRSTSSTVASIPMGTCTTIFSYLAPNNTGGVFTYDLNDSSFRSPALGTNPQGAWIGTRTASNAYALYKNGSSTAVDSNTGASGTMSANPLFIFALNNNSASNPTNFFDGQISAAFVGSGLTGTQAAAVNTRINAYMAALSANVY